MACIKVRYISRKQAKTAIKEINRELKKRGKEPTLKDAYFCHDCLFWHITSIPKQRSRDLTRHHKNLKNNKDE